MTSSSSPSKSKGNVFSYLAVASLIALFVQMIVTTGFSLIPALLIVVALGFVLFGFLPVLVLLLWDRVRLLMK